MRIELSRDIRYLCILLLMSVLFVERAESGVSSYHEFVIPKGGNEIPMSGITALTHDDDGFVWGASRMGIIRATPSNVTNYELPVSTSDVMLMKLAYNEGVLAAATQNGQIFRYNRVKDSFERWFSLADILGKKEWISNLFIADDGVVWISTSIGIFTYSDGKLIRFSKGNKGYSYILRCEDNEMFALDDDHFYIVSGKNNSLVRLPGSFDQYISYGAYDKYHQRILMGTYKGELWEYKLKDMSLSQIDSKSLPNFIVRSIVIPDSETFLIGMEGGGIIVFDSHTNKIADIIRDDIDYPASLKGNNVFAMSSDRNRRLWVATTTAGLQYSDIDGGDSERIRHRYHSDSSIQNDEINYLLTDKDGNLWVATNDGISRRDNTSGIWRNLYGKRQISALSLTQDKQGRIYASTYGNGIYVLDPATCNELAHFTGKDARIFGEGAYVFATFTDSDGDIWFGGVKGDIICYSPKTGEFRKYESHPVFCFAEQQPGKILTGGGDGLILIDKQTGKSETLLSENVVQQILVDGNDWWLSTSGNGVIRMDRVTGNITGLTVKDGLHSNFTRSLIKKDGKLWIGTALGMSCYDIKNDIMLRLPGMDIFSGDAFRENSSSNLSDGKLAFGTNNGIITFHPEKILNAKNSGKIFFSDIKVSGRSIRMDSDSKLTVPIDSLDVLTLDYPRNSFTLSMLPLGNVGSNVMYSWILEGIDKEWTELSGIPLINYVNLNQGKYELKVRMYDGGIVSERELTIRVKPPFWQTTWFRLIIVVVAVVLLFIYGRHYVVTTERRHAFEKLLLLQQLTEDLKHQSEDKENEAESLVAQANVDVEIRNNPEDSCEEDILSASEEKVEAPVEKIEDRTECVQTAKVNGDVDKLNHKSEDPDKTLTTDSRPDDEFLAEAVECVKANISNESFGKVDFAEAMRISQSHLYKKIKTMTNMSVVEFIRSIRLNHAMTLLSTGRYNVTEVSELCGFSSSAYFSRVFKESFGKIPSDFIP